MKDAGEVFVPITGAVYLAPVGAGANTDPDDQPGVSHRDVGFITVDGVSTTNSPAVQDIETWTEMDPIRRIVTGRPKSISLSLQQFNQGNMEVLLGGGTWSESGGVYTYTPPEDGDDLPEFELVVDWIDGDRKARWIYYRVTTEGGFETTANKQGELVFPVTFTVLTPEDGSVPFKFHSNDPAFAEAS